MHPTHQSFALGSADGIVCYLHYNCVVCLPVRMLNLANIVIFNSICIVVSNVYTVFYFLEKMCVFKQVYFWNVIVKHILTCLFLFMQNMCILIYFLV